MTYYVEVWQAHVLDRFGGVRQNQNDKARIDVDYYTDTTTSSLHYALRRRQELWDRGQSARVVDYLGHRHDDHE